MLVKKYSYKDLTNLEFNELKQHCIDIRSKINRNRRTNNLTKELEIYFCYVLRELESRSFVQHFKN